MVSVHSTYNHTDHPHGHSVYVKKRRKVPTVDPKAYSSTRPSWADANLARWLIKKVNKQVFETMQISKE